MSYYVNDLIGINGSVEVNVGYKLFSFRDRYSGNTSVYVNNIDEGLVLVRESSHVANAYTITQKEGDKGTLVITNKSSVNRSFFLTAI